MGQKWSQSFFHVFFHYKVDNGERDKHFVLKSKQIGVLGHLGRMSRRKMLTAFW
jgi:hypothetical protein